MSLVSSRLGHYQLLRQIGSGGMGTIYLAQDTHMPRQVAVKVVRTDDELPDNSDASQKMEKLFYREMQAIAQLDHPHILPDMMQPPDPSSLNSQLSSSIDEVIKRALAKQSSDRFPSILEFAHTFAHVQALSGDQQSSQLIDIPNISPSQGLISTVLPTLQSPQPLRQTPVPASKPSLTLSTPNQPSTQPVSSSQPMQINELSMDTPAIMPGPISQLVFPNNPGRAEVSDPFVEVQASHAINAQFTSLPTISLADGYPSGSAKYNVPAPSLPDMLPNSPANPAVAQLRKFSTRQIKLLIALIVLSGSGTLLFKSITAPKNSFHGSALSQGSPQSRENLLSGQTPAGSGGIIVTPTPTTRHSSTPTSRAISVPATASTPISQPISGITPTSQPAATPTPVSSTATPTPVPPSCVTDTWTSHLRPTFSKGGSVHYVSSYCSGVVSLSLTQAPASGGNEVDFQICYALNSTNCSSWVPYTAPNVWSTMATGLSVNQAFYINTRCNSCTSYVTLNGGVKY